MSSVVFLLCKLYNRELLSYTISETQTVHAIMTKLKDTIEKISDCTYRRTFHSDQRGVAK